MSDITHTNFLRMRRISIMAMAGIVIMPMGLALAASIPHTDPLQAQSQAATSPLAIPPPAPSALDTAKGIVLPVQPPSSNLTINATDVAASALTAEDQARKAQDEATQARLKREEEHNMQSFDRAEAGLMPLSNEQVRAFMHKVEGTQEAAQSPSGGPPKGNVRIVNLQLDPGVQPPQINLASNYVTTIDILDSTGAPWPILDVGVGGTFEVSPTPAGSHVVRVMPLSRVADGNLSVLLKDLPTPVIFRLSSGGGSVDMRAEVRVPKFGPNARVPLVNRPPQLEAGDGSLLALLQNDPPSDAKRLKVSGLDARTMAWNLGAHNYVRTPLTLLSPAWSASVSSGDGMTVYEIGDAPVLLMSDNGAMIRAHVLRDDTHDK